MLNKSDKLEDFFRLISNQYPFKIGFDSCSVSGLIENVDLNSNFIEPCESARFSAFISEDLKSYKGNSKGVFFNSILDHFNVIPEQVLHIGDSSSDIIGASKLNIDTCWINRHEYKKHFEIVPTYEIKSLEELYPILEL